MPFSPINNVFKKLKSFAQSEKNKNKCTPKYTLKLICDQLKYGQPIYRLNSSQKFDSNKMEIFCFEVFLGSGSSKTLKGENLPYGKYKTAQHLAALDLLKRIFDTSNEKKIGNEILDLLNSNKEIWYEKAPLSKNQIHIKNPIQDKKPLQSLMSIAFKFDSE